MTTRANGFWCATRGAPAGGWRVTSRCRTHISSNPAWPRTSGRSGSSAHDLLDGRPRGAVRRRAARLAVSMAFDWQRQSGLGIAFFVIVGILFGLAGRRWRTLKAGAVVMPLIAAIIPLLYFVLEGNVSACTGSASTFRCEEVSYASTWSVPDWILVGAVFLLTLAPILSALLRSAIPSVLAAMILAGAFVVGAAIAGPPPSRGQKGREPTPAR